MLQPAYQLLQDSFFTFGYHLHAAILSIRHPACDTKPGGFVLGMGAKRHTLHPSIDGHTNSLACH
jgi:hypothetical protein